MPRKTKMKWHGGRALLNLPGHQATAAIVAEIEDTAGRPVEEYVRRPRFCFQIANCDRSIAFDLDFDSEDERANNLYKLDTMIKALTEFRVGVAVENERFAERRRRGPIDE